MFVRLQEQQQQEVVPLAYQVLLAPKIKVYIDQADHLRIHIHPA